METNGSFVLQGDYGFSQKIFWEIQNGSVAITAVQLQSKNYGSEWYPGGEITVNGETVFTMSFMSPASHVYYMQYSAGSFVDIDAIQGGQELPAVSDRITGGKATIEVNVYLYNKALNFNPHIAGSVEIDVASVLAMVHDGAKFRLRQPVVWAGSGCKKYRPVILDGENGPASGSDISVATSGDAILIATSLPVRSEDDAIIITTSLPVSAVGDAIIIGGA